MANLTLQLGPNRAGLTLIARLFSAGEQVGDDLADGFTDEGIGVYTWSTTDIPPDFAGLIRFYDDDGVMHAAAPWPDVTLVKIDQILSAVQAWNPAAAVSSSAVLEGGHHVITVRGDDYTVDSPRGPLEWTITDATDLAGASVLFTSRRRSDDAVEVVKAGTILNPSESTKTIRVELTAAETAALTPGDDAARLKSNKFDVQITLADGTVWTPIRGGDNLRAGGHTIVEDQSRS